MTIQPELYPLLRWRTTLATTPSPRMIRIAVPNSSARRADMVGRAGRAMGILRASAGDCSWQGPAWAILACTGSFCQGATAQLVHLPITATARYYRGPGTGETAAWSFSFP